MQSMVKQVKKWGNSAGVALPKEWINFEVKITIVDRTLEIKKEIFNILSNDLHDILGIYLVGSYARGEQCKDSDIDVLVISGRIKKEIVSGKYHVSVVPLENIKKTLNQAPIMIYPRIIEAQTILNENLLNELKLTKVSKRLFKKFISETVSSIKINQEIVELDKLEGEVLESQKILYSLILRLRGIFILKSILNNNVYSNKNFKKFLLKSISEKDFNDVYRVYRNVRNSKKIKSKVKILVAEKLLNLLKEGVKNYDK